MSSLQDCIKRAGKALTSQDRNAIEALVADGMSEIDAVEQHLQTLNSEIQNLADQVEASGGTVARDAVEPGVSEEALFQRPNATAGDFKIHQDRQGFTTVFGNVDEIRGHLPEGLRGTVVPKGLRFTPVMSHRIVAALNGDELAFSRGGKVVAHRKSKDGKYIGASAANNTPAKMKTWRKKFKDLALEGLPGRFWYENSGAAVLEMAGGNVEEAKKFIALLAIYSPQAKVDANSTFALRAWGQYKAGIPIRTKTGDQDKKATAILYENKPWDGEKTSNFYGNLLREVDPNFAEGQGATIDMWMMRAGFYHHDAPTSSEYAFMENETNRLAKELEWEPQQVQAAIWVAIKARMENKGVKKTTDETSKKKKWLRFDKNSKGKLVRNILDEKKHSLNWVKHAMAHNPTAEDTAFAKFDFNDGLIRHIGQIAWEARPSTDTAFLPGIHAATYEQQEEFQLAIMDALSDEHGADLLAQHLGILVDGTPILPGAWEGEVSPSTMVQAPMAPAQGGVMYTDENGDEIGEKAHKALSAKEKKKYTKRVAIDPSQRKVLDLYVNIMGLVLRQDGVGYHKPFFGGSIKGSNGIDFDIDRAFTPAETKAFETEFDKLMLAAGHEGWGKSVGLVSVPTGIRVIKFYGDLLSNKDLHIIAKSAFKTSIDADSDTVYFASDGDMAENNWEENTNGQDYQRRISTEGSQDLLRWTRDVLNPKVQEVYEDFSDRYGWGDPGSIEIQDPEVFNQDAKGYYDPTNSLIRLTESSDLSTFLHEFAHFMYEMEMRTGSTIITDVNEWYKRNADAVAAEANSYLEKTGDVLEQAKDAGYEGTNVKEAVEWTRAVAKGLDMSLHARHQRAKAMGFDIDKTWYHGTDNEFKAFDLEAERVNRATNFEGVYFSSTGDEGYGSRTIKAHTRVQNTADYKTKPTQAMLDEYERLLIEAGYYSNEEWVKTAVVPEFAETGRMKADIDGKIKTKVMKAGGFDSFHDVSMVQTDLIVFDPKDIRSIDAAFDPDFTDSDNIYAQSDDISPKARKAGFNIRAFHAGKTADIARFDDAYKTELSSFGFHFGTESQAQKRTTHFDFRGEGQVTEFYLKLNNPLRVNHRASFAPDWLAEEMMDLDIITDEQYTEAAEAVDYDDIESGDWLVKKLKAAGYDGLVYANDGREGAGDSYVTFDNNQIRGIEAEFADLESDDLLAQGDTPAGQEGTITAQKVINFLDQGTTGDAQEDAAIRRAVHEQFARGFEAYLMEGKAPSVELRNAFQKFARWLAEIYKSMSSQLKVNLDDEMRAVFDRLLATEDQIAAAETRSRIEPLFTDAAMAGMTDDEFADYNKAQEKVKDVQSETLRDKLIKQLTRMRTKEWNVERDDIIDEEIDKLEEERVYKARKMLRGKELKLDRAAVKEAIGVQRTDKRGITSTIIPPALSGMHAPGQEGVQPDEAAAFLGYSSGSEMLQDLLTAPTINKAAEATADATMKERHGDILTDGTIEAEADAALQSEERGKLILRELKILARGNNQRVLDRKNFKDIAATKIAGMSYKEINPQRYRYAEIKSAKESARLLEAGNREGAARAKEQQTMNYYLAMEATRAKTEVLKIVDHMARYRKKKVQVEIMKAGNEYWEQIVGVLERFEFRKSATMKSVERKNTAIDAWFRARVQDDGDGLDLSPAVLNELYTEHWKNVPFDALQGISDSVKNMEYVARYSNKIQVLQEKLDFNTFKAQYIAHLDEQPAEHDTKTSRSRLEDARKHTVKDWVDTLVAQLGMMPYITSWLDGGKRIGESYRVFNEPFTVALDRKFNMMKEFAQPVFDMLANRSKEDITRHNRKIWIPAINDNLMGHQILAVALNTGNAGNLRKMMLGEGWVDPDSDQEITRDEQTLQAILKHMSKSDWQMVQTIWNQMNLLYPMLAETEKSRSGVVPPKVESTPFDVTIDGETFRMEGGYYPMTYSRKRSHKADKLGKKKDEGVDGLFGTGDGVHIAVKAGAANERTQFYDRVFLSMDVIPNHFGEVIHFITHHDAVRQTNKILNDPEIEDAITRILGEEAFKQMPIWLDSIAKDGRYAPNKTYIDSAFQRLRFGTTLITMGFKATTSIMQLFGLVTTVGEVGLGPTLKGIYRVIGRSWYMKAVRKTLGSPDATQAAWEFASERSRVLNHRVKTMDRELRTAFERLGKPKISSATRTKKDAKGIIGKTGNVAGKTIEGLFTAVDALANQIPYLPKIQEMSMMPIAWVQLNFVDLPTWTAAFDKTLAETGDEEAAIQYADWAVEALQGSGATKDMSTLMATQSKTVSIFTMFMTFFSALGMLTRDLARGVKHKTYTPSQVTSKLMFFYALPVFLELLMRGEIGDDDDDEYDDGSLISPDMDTYLTQLALYPMASYPFVRDVASGYFSEYGYTASPVTGVLERGIESMSKAVSNATSEDGEVTRAQIKNTTKLLGTVFGIPGIQQAWQTGEAIEDILVDGEEASVRPLLFGPKHDK